MEENLVGYLFNSLDPEVQREVENYLSANPDAQRKLDTLRQALEPLAADKDGEDAPPGMVFRTLARVAEYRCRPLPQAPEPPPAQLAPVGRRWYRRPDILIAASLLIVVGGVSFPGIAHLRGLQSREACANNLHLFHEAMNRYTDTHGEDLPRLGTRAPRNVAGLFVPVLHDAGVLPEDVTLRCPANGPSRSPRYTMQQLQDMSDEEFNQVAQKIGGCYAYPLGYHDQTGEYCGVKRDRTEMNNGLLPVMADRPLVRGENDRDNSPNHNGQNVLYMGGHVRFCKNPNAGIENDHIFLNKHGKVAAGVDRWDTVLGCSEDRP
ncbi:MAG: hypothetical protein K2R98_18820 [Gemmataceae bacterium]|nr:hypothetical protein [Gemmataceae bacterium]